MEIKMKKPHLCIRLTEKNEEQSLRQLLQSFLLSKKTIHEMYMQKDITVNQQYVSFDTRLTRDDEVKIHLLKSSGVDFIPQQMNLDIVYEDDHLLMVNKPAGLMVHPDQKDKQNTLVNGIAYYYEQKQYYERIRYIHRIDTDTSGIVIFAKHHFVHARLDAWLADKTIHRYYLAFVEGKVKQKKQTIKASIGRDRHHNARRRVTKSGDEALTHCEVISTTQTYSQVKLKLMTGRTHQIRVHMSYIGHPLIADILYGAKRHNVIKRHALHAYEVRMPHPLFDKEIHVMAPLPKDLEYLKLGK